MKHSRIGYYIIINIFTDGDRLLEQTATTTCVSGIQLQLLNLCDNNLWHVGLADKES